MEAHANLVNYDCKKALELTTSKTLEALEHKRCLHSNFNIMAKPLPAQFS
jgi:hypothetical protein